MSKRPETNDTVYVESVEKTDLDGLRSLDVQLDADFAAFGVCCAVEMRTENGTSRCRVDPEWIAFNAATKEFTVLIKPVPDNQRAKRIGSRINNHGRG